MRGWLSQQMRRAGGALAWLAVLASCTDAPIEGVVPQEVSVAEPVARLVARGSAGDLDVNVRCAVVNATLFMIVREYGEMVPDATETDRVGAMIVNGTLAEFFTGLSLTELRRSGYSAFAARRNYDALFLAYVQAYLGADTPPNSPARRAQTRRLTRDLEYCNGTLAGLPS